MSILTLHLTYSHLLTPLTYCVTWVEKNSKNIDSSYIAYSSIEYIFHLKYRRKFSSLNVYSHLSVVLCSAFISFAGDCEDYPQPSIGYYINACDVSRRTMVLMAPLAVFRL